MVGPDRHADADGRGVSGTADLHRFDAGGSVIEALARQDDDELVAAVAGDGLGVGEGFAEDFGEADEELVAGEMTVAVVVLLEAIDIEDDDGEVGAVGRRLARWRESSRRLGSPVRASVMAMPRIMRRRRRLPSKVIERLRAMKKRMAVAVSATPTWSSYQPAAWRIAPQTA